MKNESLVSICIPTHNSERFLRETLDSVIFQTYKNKEIVIVDNASTDKTWKIILEYVKKYNSTKIAKKSDRNSSGEDMKYKIRCYRNKGDIGAEANFNKCLKLARGDYITVYHSDDLYDKNIVSECVNAFKRFSNLGVVFTQANIIDENSKIIGTFNLPKEVKESNPYAFDEIFRLVMIYGNFMICPSAMIRRGAFKKLGGWEFSKFKTSADLGLWLKISKEHSIMMLDKKLINYRTSSYQGSWLSRKSTRRADYFLVMDYYFDEIKKRGLEKYYYINYIKDLSARAFNCAAKSKTKKSNHLIKKMFLVYIKNIKKIGFRMRIWVHIMLNLILFVLNIISIEKIKRRYISYFFKLRKIQ